MRAIDTNVLVRLIARDDAQQTTVAERFIDKGAWVSSLALVETIWVLDSVYRLPARSLADAVAMLLDHRDLALQDAEAVTAALALFRANPKLRFSDCMMLQLARKAGHLPLGTFDRNLGRMDGVRKL